MDKGDFQDYWLKFFYKINLPMEAGEKYAHTFVEQQIMPEHLHMLTNSSLENLGVDLYGHRFTILSKIKEISKQESNDNPHLKHDGPRSGPSREQLPPVPRDDVWTCMAECRNSMNACRNKNEAWAEFCHSCSASRPFCQSRPQRPRTPGMPRSNSPGPYPHNKNKNFYKGRPGFKRTPTTSPTLQRRPSITKLDFTDEDDDVLFYRRNQAPSFKNHGLPFKNQGPLFKNQGPPFNDQGPPFKNQGSPFKSQGSTVKNKGPLFKNQGSLYQNQDPLFMNQASMSHNYNYEFRGANEETSSNTDMGGGSNVPSQHSVSQKQRTSINPQQYQPPHQRPASPGLPHSTGQSHSRPLSRNSGVAPAMQYFLDRLKPWEEQWKKERQMVKNRSGLLPKPEKGCLKPKSEGDTKAKCAKGKRKVEFPLGADDFQNIPPAVRPLPHKGADENFKFNPCFKNDINLSLMTDEQLLALHEAIKEQYISLDLALSAMKDRPTKESFSGMKLILN